MYILFWLIGLFFVYPNKITFRAFFETYIFGGVKILKLGVNRFQAKPVPDGFENRFFEGIVEKLSSIFKDCDKFHDHDSSFLGSDQCSMKIFFHFPAVENFAAHILIFGVFKSLIDMLVFDKLNKSFFFSLFPFYFLFFLLSLLP
jgi:hypothetical protein